jgi:hypothetical protein
MLWEKRRSELKAYFSIDNNAIADIKILRDKGLVLYFGKKGWKLNTKKVLEALNLGDSNFWEVYNLYAPFVRRPDGGTRSLRPISTNSVFAKTCLSKYNQRIKTKKDHNLVVKCLKAELEDRTRNKKLSYMKGLDTYINQSAWQHYEYLLDIEKQESTKKPGYGQGLI